MSEPILQTEFVKQFHCLGADCPDTCCKGWGMQVDEKTYALYTQKAPELLNAVTGTPEHYVMQRDAKTDYCVKFSDGWCGIQKQYGENYLGDACYLYPRATRALGDKLIMTAAPSCPEIVRLALAGNEAFTLSEGEATRLPQSLHDYLPAGLAPAKALDVHRAFIESALNPATTAERAIMQILTVSQSLERIQKSTWADAVPFYLENADKDLPAPETSPTDPFFLLQALCGLIVAAKKIHNERLMQTVHDIEQALHVTVRMDTLAIVPLPDGISATAKVIEIWNTQYQKIYAPVLKRYLAMQLSLALFPFGGFGDTLPHRAAIIGIRLATIKLALMSASSLKGKLEENDVIRIIQSISRFLDHLSEANFSLQIYGETGWLKSARLRALLQD